MKTTLISGTQATITYTVTSTYLTTDLATTSGTATQVTTTSSGAVETSAKSGNSVGGGLSGPALVAVAVIIPLFILAIVGIALILYFRKRRKNNNILTKGGVIDRAAVAPEEGRDGTYEMDSADNAGYRGWGSTAGGRKTTVAGSNTAGYPISSTENTVSDGGYNNPAGAGVPGYSGTVSELYSGINTPSSPVYPDSIGLLAAGRVAPSPAFTESTMGVLPTFDSGGGLNRGISNASSNYSAVTHSDQSDYDRGQSHYYGSDTQEYDAAYFSNGSHMYYDDPSNPPPVIRDVEARRNTRIETPTSAHSPQHGSSGLAQNF